LCFLAVAAARAGVPVTDGLLLELDAREQSVARAAAGLPKLGNFGSVDRWLDASGHNRHAIQPLASARPQFRAADDDAFLHFDGKDDFLTISGSHLSVSNVTLFVLAAPRTNAGAFSGLFSAAADGQNDFTSGLNLDMGPAPTKELSVINVESAGSPGFKNFLERGKNLAAPLPFAGFHVFSVRWSRGTNNQVYLDQTLLGDRARSDSTIGLDEFVLGGRLYSLDASEPPHAQGFFQGDIAAVLLYGRALSDVERERVEQYLFARIPSLNALAAGSSGHPLEVLTNAPLVQMLVPGFTVQELPLKLRNQNNLRYRHDGKVVALGYDGTIRLLSDSDGDGLEDTATIFWTNSVIRSPVGMELLPKGDPRGDGVYLASKDKVALILDKNRDGIGDEEIIVASGWKNTFHAVDALGIAISPKDGSIYFSIGVENFANAYLINPTNGKSDFRLASDHGTIQRVSPDFSKRETVCTGVRFGCALAFNREGDLFATDQEGATWLPNGNPLDELLQIVPGRHYGFPPRHPRHLPEVIDEPAVMEYGPQHQSTVGMVFNESVNGGPVFGPASWAGNALICGESRGKLYRTKLVKTPDGYVGQNQIIGCLSMLAIDCCVSPQGDLLISCHSGPPDWGTGPAGEGKIFKVRYARKDLPQPVVAWASAPDEFRIAFDRPLRPEEWAGAKSGVRVEAGRYVSAGDRYEVIRPGYQIVRDQMTSPRRWVEVQSLTLSSDQRTLVLRVPRQTEAVNYAITLAVPESWRPASKLITQLPEMDVAVSLNGVQATLETSAETTKVILPHGSLPVARQLTVGSTEHERFFERLNRAATGSRALSLQATLNIANMFVPAIQPGSTLDWDIAADAFANRVMTVRENLSQDGPREVHLDGPLRNGKAPLKVTFKDKLNDNGGLTFALDERTRPIAVNRFFVPWATDTPEKPAAAPVARTDVKGSWLHGRRLFFGPTACSTCHTIRGEGIPVGPDLSNLIFRDRESVLKDILQPSATINPDHTASKVKFTDGEEASGIVRVLNDQKIILRQGGGVETERPRREVASIEPLKTSLMPEGFGTALSAAQQEDLLTFLLTNPLEPAPITRTDPGAPPARSWKEFVPFLTSTNAPSAAQPPLRILLVGDEKDHGLNEHDYPLWLERWPKLLALADNVSVTTAKGFPTAAQLHAADVTVFYSANSGWNAEAAALLDEYQKRGGGLVYLHWGIEGRKDAKALSDRIGLAFATSKFRHGPLELKFTGAQHPITEGFTRLNLVDESYWELRGNVAGVTVLAESVEENQPHPMLWIKEREKGRVFASIPGHYTWTFDDPLYRVIVLRGIAWAARQSNVNRLTELALVGTIVPSR
jgi:putative heme-binding domain-containing protein